MSIKISTSVLSADFACLGEEIKKLEKAGTDLLHFDVMDGAFVPNLTFGAPIIKSLRKYSTLPFDVHLMINNPEHHIESFVKAGADIITIHAEATTHVDRVINLIKSHGVKVGVSLVPSTNENVLKYIIDKLDLILVMTVNPGFGGQEFLPSQLTKIQSIKSMIQTTGKDISLSVDGGVNKVTAPLIKQAGADILVSGNYIFTGGSLSDNITTLKNTN